MISTKFLRQRQTRLVEESGLEADTVSIEICLCREPKKALKEYLSSVSLVIIGGKKRWWRAEQRLAKWLGRAGHQVLFADLKHDRATICKPSKQSPCRKPSSIRISSDNPALRFLGLAIRFGSAITACVYDIVTNRLWFP